MGLKYSKLSPWQTGQLLKLFVAGSTARTAAGLVGVHRTTAALFVARLAGRVVERLSPAPPGFPPPTATGPVPPRPTAAPRVGRLYPIFTPSLRIPRQA